MALIVCTECSKQVSSLAAACPHCGMPPAPTASAAEPAKAEMTKDEAIRNMIFVVIVVGAFIWWIVGMFTGPSSSQSPTTTQACKADDLRCLGDKGTVAAGVRCASRIEKLATHSVKWTDEMMEMKFSRFRWKDKNAGLIAYIGDKAMFQNGFGAFTPVTYECVLSPDNNTVLDVSVREGRLPAD